MYGDWDSNLPSAGRVPILLGLGFSLHSVTLMFVFANILVKRKRGKLGVDDALICVASMFALAVVVVIAAAYKYGFGLHMLYLLPESVLPIGKCIYTLVALSTVCFALTKTAMLCFYLRFAVDPRFKKICHITIAFTLLNATATLLVNLFGCRPLSAGWDTRQPGHKVCITTTPFYIYSAVNQVVMDIWLMVLPIQIVMGLTMGWLAKLGLMAMFSMGFLIVGPAFAVFIAFIVSPDQYGVNILWAGADSWIWTIVALNVGIMTTCMPGMKMFVKWILGSEAVRVVEDNTIGGGARGRRNCCATTETGTESGSRV